MTAKSIIYDQEAQNQIAKGVRMLADAVSLTLGPRGRHVVLERGWGGPLITKDGATVAKEIELYDHFENLGAQMIKEVALKTADVVGDGTTTATLLAHRIYAEGAKLVSAGMAPTDINRGVEAAVTAVTLDLKRQSRPIKGAREIAQIATISANGDADIGRMLSDAMSQVGEEGIITIEEAQTMDTVLEVVEGMQIDRGYLSPYFVTDAERMEVVLDDAFVLVHEKTISSLDALLPLLELVAKAHRPLLVLAGGVDGEALATLVVNLIRGSLSICAVKAPGYGTRQRDAMEDVAALTGATMVTPERGMKLEHMTLATLGQAKKVVVEKDHTTFIEGAGAASAVDARLTQLRSQIDDAHSAFDKEKLQERLAQLTGGVAVIRVGAASELELQEKKARVDDALHATRAAVAEGVVPGGGVALLRAIPVVEALARTTDGDARYGVEVIRRALEEPMRQLAINAGEEGGVVVRRVREGKAAYGFNAATEQYEDLVAAGVIDPTQVVRVALQNAASVASMLLTTEVLVARATADHRGSQRPKNSHV